MSLAVTVNSIVIVMFEDVCSYVAFVHV